MNTDDQDDTQESDGTLSFGGSMESSNPAGPSRPTVPFGNAPQRRTPDPQGGDAAGSGSGTPTFGRVQRGFGAGGAAPGRRPSMADVDLTGQLLDGKYRVLRLIGRGSFGAVYEAVDQMMKAPVAIKVLAHAAAADTESLEQFLGEARLLTHLDHPCVVRWITIDQTPAGLHFFVMELLRGRELAELLASVKRLAPERAIRMLLQILSALRAAHFLPDGKCLLHLDLKPANIFVIEGPPETVKVIDFGMSQHVGAVARAGSGTSQAAPNRTVDLGATIAASSIQPGRSKQSGLSVTRARGGTFAYASPEQCMHLVGETDIVELDGRSDMYSLGIVAYEMLTGQLPWQCKTVVEIVRAHVEQPVPRLAKLGVKVPRGFQAWLDRCLAKKLEDRFANVKEALIALERVAHPPSKWPLVVAAAFTVMLAILWWNWTPNYGQFTVLDDDHVLYFGPEQKEQVVRLANLSAAIEAGPGYWRDADQRDIQELVGCSTDVQRPQGSAEVRIAVPARATKLAKDAYLHAGAARRTQHSASAVRIVYLPKESWSVDALVVDGAPPGAVVDPEGAVLVIPIRGIEADHVAEVVVVGGAPERVRASPRESGSSVDRCEYQVDLQRLNLPVGKHTLHVEVADKARNTNRSADIALDVDPRPLEFEARLDGAENRINKVEKGAYVLYRDSAPQLTVENPNRPATFEVEIQQEGQAATSPRAVDGSLDLSFLANAEKPSHGTLVIRAKDTAYHKVPARGRSEREIRFRYETEGVKLSEKLLRSDGASLVRRDLKGGYSTNEDFVILHLERGAKIAVDVDIEVTCDGATLLRRSFEELQSGQSGTVRIPLGTEGIYSVRMRCFRVSVATGGRSEDPELVRDLVIQKDTSAPTARRTDTVAEAKIFRQLAGTDALLGLDVLGVGEGGHLECVVGSETYEMPLEDGRVEVTWDKLRWQVDGIGDGPYEAKVSVVDAAGNRSASLPCSFEVARRGPVLDLLYPVPGESWEQRPYEGGRQFQVRVRASDSNGVEKVVGVVKKLDTGEKIELAFKGMAQEWSVWFIMPSDWAGAQVDLAWWGEDKRGNPAAAQNQKLTLVNFDGVYASEVVLARKGSVVPPTSMRLVRGARDYLFGGSFQDRQLFKDAELLGVVKNFDTRKVTVEDFYVDVHEVTVAQFVEFLKADDGYRSAGNWSGHAFDVGRIDVLQNQFAQGADGLPATGLDWYEASAFASWAGKRLLKLEEYEYAVRGGDAYRMSPWGNKLPRGAVNVMVENGTLKVVSYGGDEGDVTLATSRGDGGGIRGLFSNAAEWLDADAQGQAWVAQASFDYPSKPHFRLVAPVSKGAAQLNRGFRCAVDAKRVERISRGDDKFGILPLQGQSNLR